MTKGKLFLLFNIIIVLCTFGVLSFLGNRIDDRFLEYAEMEATRISKYIVNYAVQREVVNSLDDGDLFTITRNSDDEIKTIDFNGRIVNQLLLNITNNILNMFREFETGSTDVLDLSNNILSNTPIRDYRNGVIFDVPLGIVSNHFALSNLGPKIPIKLSLTGEIESNVTTSIVEYGINSALITLSVNIKVSQQILMPFKTEKVTIENSIPISIKIINGNIPNYYLNGIHSNSALYNLPIE